MAVVLTACSAETTEVNKPASPGAPVPTGAQSSTPAAPANPVAHVGATLNLTGESGPLAATLSQIINPATGTDGPPTDDNGNANGSTYIAAMLTINNTSTSARKDDADNDAVLIGSDNQSYTPDFHSVTECTDFSNGEYQLGPGESANGCVVFVVPPGITPAKFKYTPSSGFGNSFGEWLIP
ncbi:DUF4352 domain-containing protein [Candidatus Mycobacterium methanotrophicum]|uniref:DUF4352 domain-containing protein n=2 Tax=Candidatus Mycobacterium methanotrophicum TaxID=2943498 RepID=A0ABY4QQX0_9MYCO|nr:DUF4352 domain-containing protein [Candidatus Mycobacterium methanotrophicum]UQX13415.1 DUF4352 domain-containing protein [Candidatus Mycobacterium methanotrophicum]